MKTMPLIGTRVVYRNSRRPERTCNGTVVTQYYGGDKHIDPETNEEHTTPDAACVSVDLPLPDWWPFTGQNRFVPDVSELEVLTPYRAPVNDLHGLGCVCEECH